MNKKSKLTADAKLRLSRQTIVVLASDRLVLAAGGATAGCLKKTNYEGMSCGGSCDI